MAGANIRYRRVGEYMRNGICLLPDRLKARQWQPHSKLIICDDGSLWVLSEIAKELRLLVLQLGIDVIPSRYASTVQNQCVFQTSKYFLARWEKPKHRLAFPYFHGHPKSAPEFKPLVSSIRKNHEHISRIQVSCSSMSELMLETGIAAEKVFKIPISIKLEKFPFRKNQDRVVARRKFGIPESAVVIGSFQKDGDGMGQGLIPKLIKGPDTLLESLKIARVDIPDLFVVLTGPARGYVKAGLTRLSIPYRHVQLKDYSEIVELYHTLDCYVVPSREEGGPRGILEAMATGVPIVSTRVGQATDLIRQGENGWLTSVEDSDEIAHHIVKVFSSTESLDDMLNTARKTAESNCYEAQVPLWRDFMDGFIEEQNTK